MLFQVIGLLLILGRGTIEASSHYHQPKASQGKISPSPNPSPRKPLYRNGKPIQQKLKGLAKRGVDISLKGNFFEVCTAMRYNESANVLHNGNDTSGLGTF